MTGWKTLTSGLLMIVWGVGGTLVGVHGTDTGVQFVLAGLGLLGLGHKLDKVGAALDPPKG